MNRKLTRGAFPIGKCSHQFCRDEIIRTLNARDSPQRGEFYQVEIVALRQFARVQRASL
jgi:hypothetical protein